MEKNSIEFEDMEVDKIRQNKRKFGFREEFRIPVMDLGIEAEIKNKKYKVSNLSSSGFQIIYKEGEIEENNEINFILTIESFKIRGSGVVKYVEKEDLDLFAAGIFINFFRDDQDKKNFLLCLESIKKSVLS